MRNSLILLCLRRIGLSSLTAFLLITLIARSAAAEAMYQLDVTYTNCSIVSGPLSFGLSTLPTTVLATFELGPGLEVTPEPGEPFRIFFDQDDVEWASITFGDAVWTSSDLQSFSMTYIGIVKFLTYESLSIGSPTAEGGVILNFPLTIKVSCPSL